MFYEVHEIENARENVAEIGAVIRLAFSDVAQAYGLTPENCRYHPAFLTDSDFAASLCRPGVSCLGAFAADSELVGFAAVWPKAEDAFSGEPKRNITADVFELTRLCVVPAHRHTGLGRQLVQAAVQSARENGACKVEIGIIAENERLKRWYEGLEFRAAAERAYAHLPFAVCEMEREVG
ncbi:MAG: GNAT family N-acetyltransferase [Oscillospiraceae bacterium]|nr:GNAT family N-acetyltransferase [Oscillospiraceae bacterium]